MVTSSKKEPTLNPNTPEALTTSIVFHGLPLTLAQVQITAAIHKLLGPKNVICVTYNRATDDTLGPKNVIFVTYNRATDDTLGRHEGIATVRYLNATVYTHRCNCQAFPILSKLIDFELHQKSLAGTTPHDLAKTLDKKPTREIFVEAITALKNKTTPSFNLANMGESLHKVEQQVEAQIGKAEARLTNTIENFAYNINSHTFGIVEKIADQQQTLNAYMLHQFQQLSTATSDFSKHMAGISNALTNGSPNLLQAFGPPNHPQ